MSEVVEQRFASLVQPHFAALYRAAMRLTRRRADAEDLVQEVCLRACSRLEDLGAVTNARAWLMRALYHLFIDATRRKRRPLSATAGQTRRRAVPHLERRLRSAKALRYRCAREIP